jgi:hypothetical protein
MASPAPIIVFDFIKKAVVTAGAGADSDRQVQEFLKQQMSQAPIASQH